MIHCVNLWPIVYQKTVVILAAYQHLIMMRSINFLLEMTKEEKVLLLLGKLHVLSNAGDSTSHACKEGPKCACVTYNYAFDHREVCKKGFIFLHDISEKQFKT